MQDVNYKTLMQSLSIYEQLEVWSWVFGKFVFLNQLLTSPFRPDKNPACKLREYDNVVFFTDFSFPEFNKFTCIHAVEYFRNKGLNEASRFIFTNMYFGVTPMLGQNQVVTGTIYDITEKKECEIFFTPFVNRNGESCFTIRDKEYWSKRFVTHEQLKSDKRGGRVYSVHHFYINNYKRYPKDVCYCYTMPSGNIKIYQPNETRKNKWLGTVNQNDFWFTNRESDKLLIIKAQKDHLIAENIFHDWDIFSGMNETVFPKDFKSILDSYPVKMSLLDSDETGIKSSIRLKDMDVEAMIFSSDCNAKDLDEYVISIGMLPTFENLPIIKI